MDDLSFPSNIMIRFVLTSIVGHVPDIVKSTLG
jgi:hypothetical protein